MDSTTNKEPEGTGAVDRIFWRCWEFLKLTLRIAWEGLKDANFKSAIVYLNVFSIVLLSFSLSYGDYAYLKGLHWLWPEVFCPRFIWFLRRFSPLRHFVFLSVFFLYSAAVIAGIPVFFRKLRLQKAFKAVGLNNSEGLAPVVVETEQIGDNKTVLKVLGNGVGIDRFQAKKGDLESAFGQIVEAITPSGNRKFVEILLCKRELTKMLPFLELLPQLTSPYTFLIGESAKGVISQDIRLLPHLLVAGTTGGGKSCFLRQALLGLLHSTHHLQLYLIDLKRGVELKDFKQLPNVKMAKTEMEAVQVLRELKDEMHKRFEFIEENNIKIIDPEVHKKDLIVLAIDEASVLYGKVSRRNSKVDLVEEARELTDELTKLARAAAIHIIIATQKAIKESLDNKTIENLSGRMAFKSSTHSGSNAALGNVDAYRLSDTKGRGIWNAGNKFIEVQTPYISEVDLGKRCKEIAAEAKGKEQAFFGPMIDFCSAQKKKEKMLSHVLLEDKNA